MSALLNSKIRSCFKIGCMAAHSGNQKAPNPRTDGWDKVSDALAKWREIPMKPLLEDVKYHKVTTIEGVIATLVKARWVISTAAIFFTCTMCLRLWARASRR